MQERYGPLICIAVVTAVIFRSEVVLLYAPLLLELLIKQRIRLIPAINTGAFAFVLALGNNHIVIRFTYVYTALTVVVDSFFWRGLVWPEGKV